MRVIVFVKATEASEKGFVQPLKRGLAVRRDAARRGRVRQAFEEAWTVSRFMLRP